MSRQSKFKKGERSRQGEFHYFRKQWLDAVRILRAQNMVGYVGTAGRNSGLKRRHWTILFLYQKVVRTKKIISLCAVRYCQYAKQAESLDNFLVAGASPLK